MTARKVGDVVVSANGYSYTYIPDRSGKPVRILTHWLIAEKKYGRPKKDGEKVVFIDKDRKNLNPSNIEYTTKPGGGTNSSKKSLTRRKIILEDRLREIRAELHEIDERLKEMEEDE